MWSRVSERPDISTRERGFHTETYADGDVGELLTELAQVTEFLRSISFHRAAGQKGTYWSECPSPVLLDQLTFTQ
jgi:hypothetical protein